MRKRVWVTRTPVVLLGSVLLIESSYFFDSGTRQIDAASRNLLFSSESPFQQNSALSDLETSDDSTSVLPPRTDVALMTPLIPFGISDRHMEGTFEQVVESGDTLSSLWAKLGASPKGGAAAARAFSEAKLGGKALRAGERLLITRRDGDIVELRRTLGEGATLVLTGGSEDGYVPRVDQARIVSQERRVMGVISSSLVDAAEGQSLPYSVVDDFVDLFSNRVEFRKDLQLGDSFSVVYDERVTETGERFSGGEIKAASLMLGGKMFAVVRDVAPDGAIRYFDEKGEMPGKFFLRYPVKFSRISSVFSEARFHPVLNVSRPHNGVDFAATTGTPVRTVGDGEVVFAGFKSATGNMVRIAHNAKYTTEYMHLSKIAANLKTGQRVARGQLIGTVGQTGLATGPHLHFGMFENGKYIDPLRSNLSVSEDEVKPPAAVLAMINELKRGHETLTVASVANSSGNGDKRA